jgi:hypothetical protein
MSFLEFISARYFKIQVAIVHKSGADPTWLL